MIKMDNNVIENLKDRLKNMQLNIEIMFKILEAQEEDE